ncbi:MAG: phosphotransferase [Pirellulaceae bacterium]|nr:phosphotransferase [Pirellulaceae bacterium]
MPSPGESSSELVAARWVLSQYPLAIDPTHIQPLGNAGGFSGARIWRVTVGHEAFGLRRWPAESPPAERLRWMHQVLSHVVRNGFSQVPVPLATIAGETLVAGQGHWWELTPWLPGAADFRQHPSNELLEAAMRALAEFHRAAASFPCEQELRFARSRGLNERLGFLEQLLARDAARLREFSQSHIAVGNVSDPSRFQPAWNNAVPPVGGHREESLDRCPEIGRRAGQLLAAFDQLAEPLCRELRNVVDCRLPLQPCIRDIWHPHVLFTDNRVTGIVDFGAMRWETVCGDVARLLGSLAGNDREAWQRGLAAYAEVRPLNDRERGLVPIFDTSGTLLGGMNWLRWIYLEQRRFARQAVLARLDELCDRVLLRP